MESTRHVLRPSPAIRAFGLAAALALAGAALTVGASAWGWPLAWGVVGLVVIVLALVLVALAWAAARRQQVTVELDDDGYRIAEPGGERAGAWAEVTRMTGAPGRLTLHHGDNERVHLVASPQRAEALDAVAADIAQRLDNSRGYTTLI